MTRRSRRSVLATSGGLVLTGCLGIGIDAEPSDQRPLGADAHPGMQATSVLENIDVPWDLTFAGEDAFLTERPGGVRRIDAIDLMDGADLGPDDTEEVLAATDLPDVITTNEGGTMGVATHPEYPETPQLFVHYTADDDGVTNRVVRYDLDEEALVPLVTDIPGALRHNGGRIEFGPDGHLWILTGDAVEPDLVRDPSSLAGAVLRITPDGDPAPNTPEFEFEAETEADPRTYTIGHRNPQGIGFGPGDDVVIVEHGPAARDEISIAYPGADYGWDIARGGPEDPEYDSYDEHGEYTAPVVHTTPDETWAPSGATFYDGDALSGWGDRLYVAGLRSETLYAVTLLESADEDPDTPDGWGDGVRYGQPWLDDRYTAVAHHHFEGEFGRLRHVEQGPGDSLYLLTSNRDGRASGEFPRDDDDRVVRIDPV